LGLRRFERIAQENVVWISSRVSFFRLWCLKRCFVFSNVMNFDVLLRFLRHLFLHFVLFIISRVVFFRAIAWRTLKEYLKLGIASVGILWFEVLASEAMTILIGTFSVSANLAAHSIGLNTLTVSFIIPVRELDIFSLRF
jgi:hypothetical protein